MTSNNNHLPSWATQETDSAQYMKSHIPNMQYEEPTLHDCPYCTGKHEDISMCPLAPKRYAVVRAFRSELQPAPSFFCYHEECWPGQKATLNEEVMLSGGSVRLVPIAEIAVYAECDECGKPFHDPV